MAAETEWQELTAEELVREGVLARLIDAGVEIDAGALVSLLVSDPETEPFLRVEVDSRSFEEDPFGQLVPRTRLFFHRPRAVDLGWDAMTLAAASALTGSVSLGSAAAVAQRLIRILRVLDDQELDVVAVMMALSKGNGYDVAVPEADILAAYEETADGVRARLKRMQGKGVLRYDASGWYLVR